MSDEALQQAIALIKAGNKKEANRILSQLIQENPNNENAWLWMTACISDPDWIQHCLEKVLEINPNNQRAQKALEKFRPPEPPPPEQLAPEPLPTEIEHLDALSRAAIAPVQTIPDPPSSIAVHVGQIEPTVPAEKSARPSLLILVAGVLLLGLAIVGGVFLFRSVPSSRLALLPPKPTSTVVTTFAPTSDLSSSYAALPIPSDTATNPPVPSMTATNPPPLSATSTSSPLPSETLTNSPTPAATPTVILTDTPNPTPTFTKIPQLTQTPTFTFTPALTPSPVFTPTLAFVPTLASTAILDSSAEVGSFQNAAPAGVTITRYSDPHQINEMKATLLDAVRGEQAMQLAQTELSCRAYCLPKENEELLAVKVHLEWTKGNPDKTQTLFPYKSLVLRYEEKGNDIWSLEFQDQWATGLIPLSGEGWVFFKIRKDSQPHLYFYPLLIVYEPAGFGADGGFYLLPTPVKN